MTGRRTSSLVKHAAFALTDDGPRLGLPPGPKLDLLGRRELPSRPMYEISTAHTLGPATEIATQRIGMWREWRG